MRVIAAFCLLAIATGTAQSQETRYVTDILRLGLHRAQDTSDSPFRNLVSGTELMVLERVPNYARVRTADGEEGWVRSAFLVSEKPAQLRVAEVEAQVDKLSSQLDAAVAEREAAVAEAAVLIASAERDIAAARAAQGELARLADQNAEYESRLELYRGAIPWPWVVAAASLALAGGFFAGWSWLDRSIRRRHGGFRVY